MPDVKLKDGKFEYDGKVPKTGHLRFTGVLIPAPDASWLFIFEGSQQREKALGNPAVARIKGDDIEFDVPESYATAAADVIRRCIDRTNTDAKRHAEESERQMKQHRERVESESNRLKAKFKGGL